MRSARHRFAPKVGGTASRGSGSSLAVLYAPCAVTVAIALLGVKAQAATPVQDVPGESLPQVLVQAPEPRFAAPTLRDRIGRIWAPVLINGRGPYRLVLDTGANHSAVIAQVADSLGIPLQNTGAPMRVVGVTGTAVVPSIPVDRFEVGELTLDATHLPVVADVFGGAQGVLGTEGLADKRILIDFGTDRVVISRSHGERAPRGFATIPLRLSRDRLLTMDVKIGGVAAKAVIDTGAQVTIGNNALREALARKVAYGGKAEDIIGVTLEVSHGTAVNSPPIAVGTLQFLGVSVTYSDVYIFDMWKFTRQPTLVLGMDVLGSVDTLIIDYKLRELQVRLRRHS